MSDKPCESCGKPLADHVDEWGRWLPCLASIGDTIAHHEAYDDD